MIGHISVEDQVDADFHRAFLKASLRRWRGRLRRGSVRERLLSFDEAKRALARWSQAHRGIRVVEVEKIVGSVGRFQDFDGSFLPVKQSMEGRWCRVDRAYHRGVELPAVSLYKLGDAYFVRDGNHRVSVARYHGVAAIDAEVTEFRGHARTRDEPAPQAADGPAHLPRYPLEPGASGSLPRLLRWLPTKPEPRPVA